MKKPVLIIGCSGAKHETGREAYNLYTGSIFTLLNSKLGGPEEVLKHFDVCILSAKHGLVTHDQYLEPYNEKMPKQRNKLGHQRYKQKHGSSIKKTINKLSSRDRDIFIVLFNDYQFALDNAFDGQLEKHLNSKFRTCYVSRAHQGIGDMRGRINRIAKLAKNNTQIDVCTFRSSISNLNELGYLAAGADFGSSLAYCNTSKRSEMLTSFLNQIEMFNQRFFLDNGFFTLVKKDKDIDTSWVFNEYETILKTISKNAAKKLYTVLPDNAKDADAAYQIIARHKIDALKLLKKTNVILPIHKCDDIRAHALKLMAELDYPEDIILGVPCVKKDGVDLRLSLEDLDALFSLKNPNTKEALFKRCHFLGMSDVGHRSVKMPRHLLANMYDVEVSQDAGRTLAIFGKDKKHGARKGNRTADEMQNQHAIDQTLNTKEYQGHNFREEFYAIDGEPFVTDYLYSLIDSDVRIFFVVLNGILADHPQLQISVNLEDSEEDLQELAWQFTSNRTIDNLIFDKMKRVYWQKFIQYAENIELTYFEKRFRTFKKLFTIEETPVQLPLDIFSKDK